MADSSNEENSGVIVIKAPEHPRIHINRWRVREGFPVSINQVILLYEVLPHEGDVQHASNKLVHKFKAPRIGVVKKRLFSDGAIVRGGIPILELSECVHTTVIKDMCADCGADLRQNENGNTSEASVPMVHSIPDLKVTQKLAQKLGHDDTRRLLQDRKLVLLVDLDQTIIHTTNDNVPNNIRGIYHFQLYGPQSPWYHTRLRPGTLKFLERMSEQYELHICTFGARNYAHMIAQILDPNGRFFSHRILSRDECFNATSKTDNLKALFPNGDSMVCIIDDREDVWNMASNLIQVKPYHFFQHTGDINAPPGLSKHELDGEGVDFKDLDAATSDSKDSKSTEADVNMPEVNTQVENELFNNQEKSETNVDEISKVEVNETLEPITSSVINEKESNSLENLEIEIEVEEKTLNACSKEEDECKENEPFEEIKTLAAEDVLPKMKLPGDPAKEIDIDDPDDYLLYLETILGSIHKRFYSIYDETQEIPDLKIVVPKIRSEVLRNCNLVFSGLVPTNMKLQQSRAYFIAKSLGANVTQNIGEDTTHLVAVTSGTYKVNAAKKNSKIKIVNSNWLWSCAERWELVDEKLFPLDRKMKGKQRQPPAHCHSPEHVVNYSEKSEISTSSSCSSQQLEPEKFIDTINPLLSFSNADLADMNKEFDQFFDSDTSSEDDHINIENPPIDKVLRKRKRQEHEEERTRKFFTRSSNALLSNSETAVVGEEKNSTEEEEDIVDDEDDDDEMPSEKFRRGGNLPSDLEVGSDSNDNSDDNNPDEEDDGEWNMMGAALEREFLGLED